MISRIRSTITKRVPSSYIQKWPQKFDNIIVAMSGGVDSSFSASLFAKYPNVKGMYMKNWDSNNNKVDESFKKCHEQDWKDACAVSKYLNIPIEIVNFEKEYWTDVFQPMLRGYENGLTPNPDVLCNRYVKFGALIKKLDEMYGTDNYWLVTGHYARILLDKTSVGRYRLFKSIDSGKDQSYYLSQIEPHVLSKVLLPLGHFHKTEVRKMAQKMNLPNALKPDSQGICFVNNSQKGKFRTFLREYLPETKGNIISIDPYTRKKTVWGQHEGLWSYTVGQRPSICMPQGDPRYKGMWYVCRKIRETNEMVITRLEDPEERVIYSDEVVIEDFKPLEKDFDYSLLKQYVEEGTLRFQQRSLQSPAEVSWITYAGDVEALYPPPLPDTNRYAGTLRARKSAGISGSAWTSYIAKGAPTHLRLVLSVPQRALAAGQTGCLYRGERVLGSGEIRTASVAGLEP